MVTVSIRRYTIVKPSTVEDFKDNLYEAARNHSHLQVQAVLDADELSLRRKSEPNHVKFTFRVVQIHTDPRDFSVEVQNVDTNEWSLISVTADAITITVVE